MEDMSAWQHAETTIVPLLIRRIALRRACSIERCHLINGEGQIEDVNILG